MARRRKRMPGKAAARDVLAARGLTRFQSTLEDLVLGG
jgi:hypothetical protein